MLGDRGLGLKFGVVKGEVDVSRVWEDFLLCVDIGKEWFVIFLDWVARAMCASTLRG